MLTRPAKKAEEAARGQLFIDSNLQFGLALKASYQASTMEKADVGKQKH